MKNNFLVFLVFFLTSCNQVDETIHGSSSGTDLSYYGEPSTPLILISIDGFRWDYFDKVETPNFDRLIANGSKADGLKQVIVAKLLLIISVLLQGIIHLTMVLFQIISMMQTLTNIFI